ncbi:FimV/HubP family polar landmark protein [Pseudomonas sp. RIT-PI-AD]|uniref:FimV/HubP family polar landmark protein n=1 Tax=Pseudomonas sp. RIT-PI-AD TaxID=3035294 RepID=UPI0021DB7FB8|nr:FimV/HubP family polar landmark protein [Pseudomonas sp. RIT-PI-AD]
MVRVRKLVLAIAAASALSSGMAHALGLGEVTLKSALNQPLDAEIELLEVRDLGSTEVIPALATPEEFNKAGVDRQFFLNDLKFTPVLKPNGKSVIRVTSSKPVREPYLNFLVEVLWPNGRLLREYTLLLDPPLYSPQTTVAAAPQLPIAKPSPRPAVTQAPRPAAPASAPRASAPSTAPSAPRTAGNEYRTTASDTLWEIAERTRAGGSVHQSMLAIQDLNPDAFVDGNINRLKKGQVLRLPDDQQIKSRSQAEALAQVAAQNNAWRNGSAVASTGARQVDATKRSGVGAAPATTENKDSLKLVGADEGKSTAGSDKGGKGDSKALGNKLAVTQESLDSTRRENEELKSRMTDLQSQLDKLQKLVQLKDDQLAKLQANLAEQGKAQPDAAAATPAPVVPAAAPVPQEPQPAVTPVPVPAPAADTPPAGATPVDPAQPAATPDYNYQQDPAAAVPPAAAPVEPTPAPPPAVPNTPAPADTAPAPVESENTSFLDDLFGNPLLLGLLGGAALLLLLVGLMVLSRRNAMKEAELQTTLSAQDDHPAFDNDLALANDGFDDLHEEPVAAMAPVVPERVAAQTTDPIGEADIYIAYGRFNQAAELLHGAIDEEPQRADLRLKLMEVYAELGDREGFARQENELREIGGAHSQIEQLRSRYPAMAFAAAAGGLAAGAMAEDDLEEFNLDDLTLDEPNAASSGSLSGSQDAAFDLSLDELEADLDRDRQGSGAIGNDFTLDDELDLGQKSDARNAALEDLDFALDLPEEKAAGKDDFDLSDDLADFSMDLDPADRTAKPVADEFLLDLDEQPAATETPGTDFELPADFDLSLPEEQPQAPADDFAAHLENASTNVELDANDFDEPAAGVPAAAELEGEDDFDFLSGTDETATKLDLARAYIDMGDSEGARDILDEVVAEGSEAQQQEARELIAKLV